MKKNKTRTISFKSTTRDQRILAYIDKQEEKSDFVKAAVWHFMNHLENDEFEDDET